jgi:acyl-coenzyme A thioesterase PaaI-like protein
LKKAKTSKKPTALVGKNFCFVCGGDNSQGMRLKFSTVSDLPTVKGTFHLAHRYMGASASAHSGIVAAIVDEAMGKLAGHHRSGERPVEITVKHLHPVPLGNKIVVEARPMKGRGKHSWRECTIRDARGRLLVQGQAEFVRVARSGD